MIDPENYCSMIHGGLHLDFKEQKPMIKHCCLRDNKMTPVDVSQPFWNDPSFHELRESNKQNQLTDRCKKICKNMELAGLESMRTGMNQGLGIYGQTDISGPARIDLMFDISCNLACRTCGAHSSTYWQKHLKEHGLWNRPIFTPRSRDEVIGALSQLDLSNLRMLVFCGGETLMGNEYWEVARWLVEHVPNAKDQLTLCFQTNGTQPIAEKHFAIIEKFHLVKLHVSIDGIDDQFHYLRWPATWTQVADNLQNLKATLPSNVMFLVEETVSIFNLFYTERLQHWTEQNFATNREGDVVVHSRHLAQGIYSIANCTKEYVEALEHSNKKHMVPHDWRENPEKIHDMIAEIERFDRFRSQSFTTVFPELAVFYARYL